MSTTGARTRRCWSYRYPLLPGGGSLLPGPSSVAGNFRGKLPAVCDGAPISSLVVYSWPGCISCSRASFTLADFFPGRWVQTGRRTQVYTLASFTRVFFTLEIIGYGIL